MLHEAVLDNKSVNLAVPTRHRSLDIFRLLIEVIVLVLCELFPPLFAPGQGHFLEKSRLLEAEVAVRLESKEGSTQEFLSQEGAERSHSNAFHLVISCYLFFPQRVLRRLMEFIEKLALFLKLLLYFCDLNPHFVILVSQIVQRVGRFLDCKVFRSANVERCLSCKDFLPYRECMLRRMFEHFHEVFTHLCHGRLPLALCLHFDLVMVWPRLLYALALLLNPEHELIVLMLFLVFVYLLNFSIIVVL